MKIPNRPESRTHSLPTTASSSAGRAEIDLAGFLTPGRPKLQGSVMLNVYDATKSRIVSALNRTAMPLGAGGAFHVAIEIGEIEWSYGLTRSGTGVSWVQPGKDLAHHFRGSVHLGNTPLSKKEVNRNIQALAQEWAGNAYHPLRRNCCHFAREMAIRLGVGPLPDWVDCLGRSCESLAGPIDAALAGGQRIFGSFRATLQYAMMPWQECCGKDGVVVLSHCHLSAHPRPPGQQCDPRSPEVATSSSCRPVSIGCC